MHRIPSSSCRLRLDDGVGLDHVERLLPYLDALGISSVALPSVLRGRRGPGGRRPVVDPTRVDPDLGGEEGFAALARALTGSGMDLVLDLIADHVIASPDNPLFRSILEEGSKSPFAHWFDVDWEVDGAGTRERLLLPILMVPYGEALLSGQVRLMLAREGFVVRVHGFQLPLKLESWRLILGRRQAALEAAIGATHPAVSGLRRVLMRTFEASIGRLDLAARLRDLAEEHPAARIHLDEAVAVFNDAGGTRGAERMHALLEQQCYRLCWRGSASDPARARALSGDDDGVPFRPDDPEALTGLHARVFEWMEAGIVAGVTVRDVDRIGDPTAYLIGLRGRLSRENGETAWIVADKTLVGDESLPSEWGVAGTVGHEFQSAVTRLLVDPAGLHVFDGAYRQFVGPAAPDERLDTQCRLKAIREDCAEETTRLLRRARALAEADLIGRDLPEDELRAALEWTTVYLPVTRTYIAGEPVRDEDRRSIEQAIQRGREAAEGGATRAFDFLQRLFFFDVPAEQVAARGHRDARLDCIEAWQRLSMEVARRSRDGALLHLDARLLSLNEPGGRTRAREEDLTVAAFHRFCLTRAERSPGARSAVATLRDLRGADVRARLHVLSEQAMSVTRAFRRLARVHRPLKSIVGRRRAPDANTEWLLYQLLLGVWPFAEDDWASVLPKLEAHLRTSLRQVGVRGDGADAEEFEEGAALFLRGLFGLPDAPFRRELEELRATTRFFGFLYGLSQALLLATAPGVPEILEGEEGWDFRLAHGERETLADADLRGAVLAEVLEHEGKPELRGAVEEWIRTYPDGRIKTFVLSQALRRRREHHELFSQGDYLPLEVRGPRADHVCAYLRHRDGRFALIAVGLHLSKLTRAPVMPVGEAVWAGTTIVLPPGAPVRWVGALGGGSVAAEGELPCARLFELLPLALCLHE